MSATGGGTSESEALQDVYGSLTLNRRNVLKIMTVMSDGVGDKAAVAPIIQQVEDDGEVIFLVIATGGQAEAVIQTYIEPLKKPEGESNVHYILAEDPKMALPQMLEFFKREVGKRRRR